ncbi:sulfatase-like hydrolase/transferase [Spirosoma sp. HMF4905]|uniref:Sulfatase-like hydrolase/transferase n=1 Tax=Spirosoma arboris TaxID=2682092 RepID=A0A7K1S693_9BACT|nr:sulfatase [Spirosoma arboris]MVM29342.1 sulfatase-like hydrolase/transferase [Spirosoma arboris]
MKKVIPILVCVLMAVCVFAQKPKTPPNIILILADDLGWHELGSYGNRFNETPNLDRLAAGGMRFTQAYATAPVCTPTRIALMTGQHPARVGITDYLDAKDEKFLSPDYVTLNEQLKKAGYHSGLIGKWHLTGDYTKKKGEPAKHGWDEVICSETGYIAGGDYVHPYFFMPDVQARTKGEYLTDRLNQEAVDFIKRNQKSPFFLYLSHYAVHTTLAGKPEDVAKYRQKAGAGMKQNNPELAAMLERVDDGVGQLIATLTELGLKDNTLILFTSDNGGELNVTSNAPLRGGKSELFEGGIREPFIAYWPGVIPPGKVSTQVVNTLDIYPTLLELASVKPAPDQQLDGISIASVLKGRAKPILRTLYWNYPLAKPHFLGGRSAGAIRNGDIKLIEYFDTGQIQLFNLADDPGEQTDLSDKLPTQRTQLLTQLREWRQKTARDFPTAMNSLKP